MGFSHRSHRFKTADKKETTFSSYKKRTGSSSTQDIRDHLQDVGITHVSDWGTVNMQR